MLIALFIICGVASFALGFCVCVIATATSMQRSVIKVTQEFTESNNAMTQALMQVLLKFSEQPEHIYHSDPTIKVQRVHLDAPVT